MTIENLGEVEEQGTAIFRIKFFDADGITLVVPNSITWTLRASKKTIVNGRSGVVVVPANQIDIVLTGDDLAIGVNGKYRLLRVFGTYDSITYGDNLSFQKEILFSIRNLMTLPD